MRTCRSPDVRPCCDLEALSRTDLEEHAMTAPTPSRQVEHIERQKQEAAERAVQFVESGMVVGLGAGSTAAFALLRIADLLRQGLLRDVVGIPCSSEVGDNARQLGIPL